MGIKGELHFVKVAGGWLLRGPVIVHSRLLDGEIEIAAIPDYCAHLRVKSYLDVFDVGDSVAVRARYEQERARGYSSDVEIHLATGAIPMGKGHRRTHEKP